MRHHHHVPALLRAALLCALSGCGGAEAVRPPAQVATTRTVGVVERLDAPSAALIAARAEIDRRGPLSRCAADAPPGRAPGGAEAWAQAWCGWRAGRFEVVWWYAGHALGHAQVMGSLRRQVELHLMRAVAAQATERPGLERELERAASLLTRARMPLVGDVSDPFAGDLGYLIGEAQRRTGHTIGLRDGRSASSGYALRLAREEYASVGALDAVAHAARAQAEVALDAGRPGEAARRLAEATRIDAQRQAPGGLAASLPIARRLARALDDPLAGELDGWVARHPALARALEPAPAPRMLNKKFPSTADALIGAAQSQAGSEALARTIHHVRADVTTAIRPPASMLRTLTAMTDAQLERLPPSAWRLTHEAGRLLYERGHLDRARAWLTRAVAQTEALLADLGDVTTRQRLLRARRSLYIWAIHGVLGMPTGQVNDADAREALRLVGLSKARGLLDLIEGRLSPAQAVATPAPSIAPGDSAETMRAHLQRRLDALGAAPKPARVSADHTLPIPAPGEVIIEYMLGEWTSYVWVVTRDDVHLRRVSGTRALTPLLEAYQRTLTQSHPSAAQQAEARRLGERLYVALLGPADDLIARATRLTVAPDGPLHGLPFEALIKPSRAATPEHLIRRVEVLTIPSLRVAAALTARPRSGAPPRGALLLGDPDLSRPALSLLPLSPNLPQRGMVSLKALFGAMPGTRAELDSAARSLRRARVPLTRWDGPQANEQAWRRADLTPYRLIHIATHGVSDASPWRPLANPVRFSQPALLLSQPANGPDDGVLRLGEVLGARTRADLIILSGCTTGRGWRTLGEGAYGLAGAFLYTGSRAVLASSWAVSDRATARLITTLYKRLHMTRPDLGAPAALRAAQLELLDDPDTAAPFHWAGFRLVGR